MSTFASTTSGSALTDTAQNPATIVADAYIANTTTAYRGDAVYGSSAAAWNIGNYGTITATAAESSGVRLVAGGNVTNAASGLIAGPNGGVRSPVGGTLTNFGRVTGTGTLGGAVVIETTAGGL